jgi:formylglycine-generating enzyme required for sulfatase activity
MLALAASWLCPAAAETRPDQPDPTARAPEGMVLIPEGEFTMGRTFATPDDETGMRPLILRDDRPPHQIRLDAFWMDATEVTHAAYAEFIASEGRRPPYHWLDGKMPSALAEHPAYNVDWHDARAFCEWKGKRLPSEAEWERAARGKLEGARYPWGDQKPGRDRVRFSTPEGPGPVAQHPANDFGLYDMAGGVAEWCQDWFNRTYYSNSPADNPKGPAEGMYRIVRGGAWSDGPNRLTVFFRNWIRPNQRTPNLGFRCVQEVR